MTLIAGYNFGEFALIAADTRVSWYWKGALRYRDDEIKLRRSLMGLITGAGLVDLLDNVKEHLGREEVLHTDRILEIVQEAREEADERWSGYPDSHLDEALDTTGWMFTYLTPDGPDGITLRLAAVSSAKDDRICHIQPGKSWMLPPTGTTHEQFKEWLNILNGAYKPLTPETDFGEHLSHHLGTMVKLMKLVSSVNEGVAETLQLGFHVKGWGTAVSSILSPPDYQHTWDIPKKDSPGESID